MKITRRVKPATLGAGTAHIRRNQLNRN